MSPQPASGTPPAEPPHCSLRSRPLTRSVDSLPRGSDRPRHAGRRWPPPSRRGTCSHSESTNAALTDATGGWSPRRRLPDVWRRFSKQLTALLLAEILFVQPTLLQAAGYDEGQQTGGQLLNQYQSPGALQQLLPKVPNYTDAQRDQYLSNPYYSQDPTNKSGLSNFERDSAQAINAPQGMTGEATGMLRARAASPWSWTFGPASSLVSGIQHNLPAGVPIAQGSCQPTAYCATPGGTSTTQTCQQTQTVEQATCTESYTIETQPNGGQDEVFHDGCAS